IRASTSSLSMPWLRPPACPRRCSTNCPPIFRWYQLILPNDPALSAGASGCTHARRAIGEAVRAFICGGVGCGSGFAATRPPGESRGSVGFACRGGRVADIDHMRLFAYHFIFSALPHVSPLEKRRKAVL